MRILSTLMLAGATGLALAASVAPVLERPAAQTVKPQGRLFLGLAQAGKRVVAVGERGLIVLSDDDGRSWRQAAVPVSVSFTAVGFADARRGWAIGHGSVVLRTDDGGERWQRQLDGRAVIKLLLEAATSDPKLAPVAQQFAADGPDKPLLALHVIDARSLIVAGAYGLALRSDDGGATWRSLVSAIDNPRGMHVYAIGAARDGVWMAGEQGYLARSLDGGLSFRVVDSPYQGTWFTAAALPSGGVLLGGLKGNLYRSANGRFEKITGLPPISLSGMHVGTRGAYMVNQAGHVLASGADVQAIRMLPQHHPAGPLAAVLPLADGSVLTAGVHGISRHSHSSNHGKP